MVTVSSLVSFFSFCITNLGVTLQMVEVFSKCGIIKEVDCQLSKICLAHINIKK